MLPPVTCSCSCFPEQAELAVSEKLLHDVLMHALTQLHGYIGGALAYELVQLQPLPRPPGGATAVVKIGNRCAPLAAPNHPSSLP